MSKLAVAMPFHVISDNAVSASPWVVTLDGSCSDRLSNIASDWDNQVDLYVCREIQFDVAQVISDLGYADKCPSLQLTVYSGTGYGLVPRDFTEIHKQCLKGDRSIALSCKVSSKNLAGSLHLRTEITLGSKTKGAGRLSPVMAGAKLWSDSLRISLEPDVIRFPVELASFNQRFPLDSFRSSPWYLSSVLDDPARNLTSALRLYVNSDCEIFCKRVKAMDVETLRQMMAGVMSQVILYSLAFDEDEKVAEWPLGSIGAQAMAWRALAFPNVAPSVLRSMASGRLGEFNAVVLAAAEFSDTEK